MEHTVKTQYKVFSISLRALLIILVILALQAFCNECVFAADNGLPEGFEADEELNRDLSLNTYGVPVHQFKNVFETETVTIPAIDVLVEDDYSYDEPYPLDEAVPFMIYNSTTQTTEQIAFTQDGQLRDLKLRRGHAYIILSADDHYIVTNYLMPGGASRYYVWALCAGDEGVPSDGAYDYKTAYTGGNDADYLRPLTEIVLHYSSAGFYDPRRVSVELPVIFDGESVDGVEFIFTSDEGGVISAASRDGAVRVDLTEDVDYTVTAADDTYDIDTFLLTVKDKSEHKYEDEISHTTCVYKRYPYDHTCCQGVNELRLYRKSDQAGRGEIWAERADSLKTYTSADGEKQPVASVTGMDFKTMLLLVRNMDDGISGVRADPAAGIPADAELHLFDLTLVNPHRWEIAEVNGVPLHVSYHLPHTGTIDRLLAEGEDSGTGETRFEELTFTQTSPDAIVFDVNTMPSGRILAVYSDQPSPEPVTPSVSLSRKSYTYSGKPVRPAVTVKADGKTLSEDDYDVIYPAGMKSVGKYTVRVALKGRFEGSGSATFSIVPKGTSVRKLKAAGHAAAVTWKKQSVQTTGYQIQYSLKKSFKGAKTLTVKKSGTTSKKIRGLKSGKKYYIRIRTYKKTSGGNLFSAWSKIKTVKPR